MKGKIYGRESSDDTERAPPVGNQIEIGKERFAELGHELTGIYKDEGLSGGNWRRPDFLRLLDELKKGEFVWAWSQNRLARDTEMFLWFVRQVKEKGGLIMIDREFIDMASSGGKLKHTVIAATDEFVRTETGEKVEKVYSHKLKKARANNALIGDLKGLGVWGRKPVPDEIRKEAIRLALENPKMTLRQITDALPSYRLISKKSFTYRKASLGWVAQILATVRVQQYPSKSTEEKVKENKEFNNSPINEHEISKK
jgi:DNA invertase Pin-like site-specific DNA recombinase